MNLKKILFSIITVMIFGIFILTQNKVYAKSAPSRYFGLNPLMVKNPNWGYSINEPYNTSDFANRTGARIWNIVEYSTETSESYSNNEDVFCLREGEGFSDDVTKRKKYNEVLDMKIDKTSVLSKIHSWNKTIDGKNQYNGILAVLDLFYIKGQSSDNYKEALLSNAGITKSTSNEKNITDSDIKAVEQAALWYFTNYGENNTGLYDHTADNSTGWLWYTQSESAQSDTYDSLSNYKIHDTDEGSIRNEQCEKLYKYLIKTAKENANKYNNTNLPDVVPAKCNTSTLNYHEKTIRDENYYILGSFNIANQDSSNTLNEINAEIKNGNTAINKYYVLNGSEVSERNKGIKDYLGQDFYLAVEKSEITDINNLSVKFNVNYSSTKSNLWTNLGEISGTQPVVILEKDENSTSFEVKPEVEKEGNYQLKLLKVDKENTSKKLQGAEFEVTLPGGTKETVTTDANGIATLPSVNITEEGTDTITVKEKKAPTRYKQLIDSLTLSVTKEESNEGYKATNVSITNGNTGNVAQASISNGTITLTVPNEKIEGSYELEILKVDKEDTTKKLSGTEFEVTLPGGTKETVTTDENGLITLPSINITQEGTETIKVKETKAPDGYEALVKELELEVTKQLKDGVYVVSNVTIKNKSEYCNVTFDDKKIHLQIVNEPLSVDFKLIKRITAVNNQDVVPDRIKDINVSKLNTIGEDGKLVTTADYDLYKEDSPVGVKKGDIVTYTFRVYNEGMIDGYVQEITEDIPEGLQFLWSDKKDEELKADATLTDEEKEAIEFNQNYLWGFDKDKIDADGKITEISTEFLGIYGGQPEPGEGQEDTRVKVTENLIKAFGENDGTKTREDLEKCSKEVSVKLKVISEDKAGNMIRNEACISEDADSEGKPVKDRDSDTEKWVKYEDDEDYDVIILQSFDLALRKFIVAVSNDETIDDNEYLKNTDGTYTRAPVVDTSKLNTEDDDGKLITTAIYNHTKQPVIVKKSDIVVYMLRIYNEGDCDGYAGEIKDHLPNELEFVDGKFNKEYGWSVSEDGRTVTTTYLKDKRITKPKELEIDESKDNSENRYVLAYKEIPIMCKVKDTVKTNEKITNIADITEYLDENKKQVTDRDSQIDNVELPSDEKLPSYKDDINGDYIPGQQDDDDFEKVIVKEFDLALRKWVTQAIVIENGGQSVTNTGHDAWDDPEQVVKVELNRKKLNQVTVKFRYSIRIYNQGDVEGYAKEITDYIPQGLKFVPEDNPGWTDEGNNVISTKLLQDTLLKPGEYADIEVLLTWINNENDLGVKINTAEISEDYNKYNLPDKDSTPDNKKQGEDDIDDAPVMLSISTGQMRIYFTIGFTILITISGGILLIKKYVI